MRISDLLFLAPVFLGSMVLGSVSAASSFITLGGGCFWCVEAVFERVPGVRAAVSGYAGGSVRNPIYEQVVTGRTGHAEVVRIEFEPETISVDRLLELFWQAHDPTTLNRQGADVGTQYRSAIFFEDEEQRRIAEASKVAAQKSFDRPIVTQIAPLDRFYRAEEYHQEYFKKNPQAGYCQFVIRPKIDKLKKTGVLPRP